MLVNSLPPQTSEVPPLTPLQNLLSYTRSHSKSQSALSPYKPAVVSTRTSPLQPSIDLDLSPSTTYLPGQTISGTISLAGVGAESKVFVQSVNVQLLGKIAVHGDKPGTNYESGVLEYLKDEVILDVSVLLKNVAKKGTSLGVCVSEIQTRVAYNNQVENEVDDSGAPQLQGLSMPSMITPSDLQSAPTDTESTEPTTETTPLAAPAAVATTTPPTPPTTPPASPTISRSSCKPSTFTMEGSCIPFKLPIPQSQSLPSSHKHKNFPITYTVVARLNYLYSSSTFSERVESSCPITLIPYLPINNWIHSIPHITEPIKTKVRSGIFKRPFMKEAPCDGHIMHSVFSPRRAFLPGDAIPLRVHMAVCSDMRVARVRVDIILRSRIVMACGLGEILEEHQIVRDGASFVFSETKDVDVPAGREFCLDLPHETVVVPADAAYSIPSVATGKIFEVTYDVLVRVRVFEQLGDGRLREFALKKIDFPVTVGSCTIVEEEGKVVVGKRGKECYGCEEGEESDGDQLPMYDN